MDTKSLVNQESTGHGYEATCIEQNEKIEQRRFGDPDQKVIEQSEPEEFTVQEAIDQMGFGWFQIKLSIVSGLTWLENILQHGGKLGSRKLIKKLPYNSINSFLYFYFALVHINILTSGSQMADSMEIMLLSILGPVLSCQWQLQPWEQALLTTLVMIGMASGSSFWGKMSDQHGRKTALVLASSLIGYFGFLSAFSPMYLWMAVCRFLVGCCLAALPQTVTLYSEYLPTQSRAACLIALEVFFAIGSAVEVILALIVMPRLGWRYLMIFSALPVLFFPILSPWLPESARYLLTCGRHKEAVAMLESVARDNGKKMPRGKLATRNLENSDRGRIKDLYQPGSRRLSIFLNILWFCLGFSYYGMALLLPTLLNKPDGCHGYDMEKENKGTCSVNCKPFTQEDYTELAVTSFADAPGLLVAFLLQLVMGRRACMSVTTVVYSAILFMCNFCLSRSTLGAFMFMIKGLISGAHQIVYIYTPECYPTNIRALGMGINSGLARLGAVVTPYVAQVGTQWSAFFSFSVYGVVGLLAALFAYLLPFDTKGRAMVDSSH